MQRKMRRRELHGGWSLPACICRRPPPAAHTPHCHGCLALSDLRLQLVRGRTVAGTPEAARLLPSRRGGVELARRVGVVFPGRPRLLPLLLAGMLGLLVEDEVLPRDDPAHRAIFADHRKVAKPHGPEERVAPGEDRPFLDRVAPGVHVGEQVQLFVAVLRSEGLPHLVQARNGLLEHLLLRDQRRWLAVLPPGIMEGAVLPAQRQDLVEDLALDEAGEAARPRLQDGEAVVGAAREGRDQALHGHPLLERDGVARHDVRGPHDQHLLLRLALQERHLLEVDVDVVQAGVEEVARPLGHNSREEDRQAPLGLARGLHEDHREGDGDARHAREGGRRAD
mmetsp:Transcript_92478/g.288273  ORF Transcript_92478/g.288273 Transcript_92478/m.288273 type:complete len:338 (-) Transcript_92478:1324-2337(-)